MKTVCSTNMNRQTVHSSTGQMITVRYPQWIFIEIRRLAVNHLYRHHAQTPHIHRGTILLSANSRIFSHYAYIWHKTVDMLRKRMTP